MDTVPSVASLRFAQTANAEVKIAKQHTNDEHLKHVGPASVRKWMREKEVRGPGRAVVVCLRSSHDAGACDRPKKKRQPTEEGWRRCIVG